jgi:hypothetical protein
MPFNLNPVLAGVRKYIHNLKLLLMLPAVRVRLLFGQNILLHFDGVSRDELRLVIAGRLEYPWIRT